MRFQRTGIGCAGDPSCPCMPNTGMASGFNVPGTLPGIPYDKALGTFDTSLSTITFPSVAPISGAPGVSASSPLQVVPDGSGNYMVLMGTQVLANGLTMPQAQDVVNQNATGAAALAANPVAANVLSGNPLQPSIVGTDDGSNMINPPPAQPSTLCSWSSDINQNPLIALAVVGAVAWLVTTHHKRSRKS